MTNSTKNFKPIQILEVFPKIFITLAFHIMDEKKHPSIRIIRILTHIHSMFLYCLKKFPELKNEIKQKIDNFIADENFRNKDALPNLGTILAMLSVTDSHKFKDIAEKYFEEQLDRQVFWILNKIPELLSSSLEEHADKMRSEIVFKTQMTSFHIFCMYKLFISTVCEKRANKEGFFNEYDENLCKLTNKEENILQREIKNISKNIVSFDQFFNYIGLPIKQESELTKMLKWAIKNSERKGYHSALDVQKWEEALSMDRKKSSQKVEVISKVSTGEEQFKKLAEKIPSYSKYISIKQEKHPEKKGEFNMKYEEKISSENDWKEMCITRWVWIKEVLLADSSLSSNEIAALALEFTEKGVTKTEDRISKIINRHKNSHMNTK